MAVTPIRDPRTGKIKAFKVEVYVDGVRIQSRSFGADVYTKSAAQLWHDETKVRAALGYPINKTFAEVLTDYERGPFSRRRKTTQQSTSYILDRYLKQSPLTRLKMQDMSPHHISEWIKWMKSQPNKSHRRIDFHQEMTFLKKVLAWYRDTMDPKFGIPILKTHRTEEIKFREKKARRPDYYIRPEDVRAWFNVMSKRRKVVYYHLAFLMIHTGLRVGEASGLCWDAVDLSATCPTIAVKRTLAWDREDANQAYFQRVAKNETSIRMMKIPPVLAEMLASIKSKGTHEILCADGEIRSPVFLNEKLKPLDDERIRYHFNQGFKKLGLEWSGTHIARHTLATLSLVATKDVSGVQAVLGHKSFAQTEKYAKVIALQFGDSLQKAADLIAGRENHSQITLG
jgi:integrase